MAADWLRDCAGEPATTLDRFRRVVALLNEASRLCEANAAAVGDDPARQAWESLADQAARQRDKFYAAGTAALSDDDKAVVKSEWSAWTS